MHGTFIGPRNTDPQPAPDDMGWVHEVDALEYAVEDLLDAKREALSRDPQHEHVLFVRYIDRLREIRRRLDAVCM